SAGAEGEWRQGSGRPTVCRASGLHLDSPGTQFDLRHDPHDFTGLGVHVAAPEGCRTEHDQSHAQDDWPHQISLRLSANGVSSVPRNSNTSTGWVRPLTVTAPRGQTCIGRPTNPTAAPLIRIAVRSSRFSPSSRATVLTVSPSTAYFFRRGEPT